MKITKRQLKRLIREAWTSADTGARAADNALKAKARPQVEEMLKGIYVGGYASDGAQSVYDVLDAVGIGEIKRVISAMTNFIVDMERE